MVDEDWPNPTTTDDGTAVVDPDPADGRERTNPHEITLDQWIVARPAPSMERPDEPAWRSSPDAEADADFSGEVLNDDGDFRVLDS